MSSESAADAAVVPPISVELTIDDPRWQDIIAAPAAAGPNRVNIDSVIRTAWRAAWIKGWPGARARTPAHVQDAGLPKDQLPPAFEVAIKLASDSELQRLNREFRGKDRPTNVLSFPSGELPEAGQSMATFPEAEIFLGDVAISIDTVIREAKDRAITPAEHVAHLTIHAMLHLLGWTHDTEPDAMAMETLETEILAKLGIANPYREYD